MYDIRLDSFKTSEDEIIYTLHILNINGNVISSESFKTENDRALRITELQSESGESGV